MSDRSENRTAPRARAVGRCLPTLAVGLAVSLAVACSNEAGGGGNNQNNTSPGECPAGTVLHETACLPVFDDCPAPDEIPMLGGGCVAIGVPRCERGPGCSAGFADDGAGGCVPTLPAAACGPGELAVIGSPTCEPLRDCGAAPWGDIQTVDGSTVHVDAGYGGGGSDGSAGAPFTTLAAALAVAPPGGHVALAAGTYVESNTVSAPVTIEGRCPALVTLQGAQVGGNELPPLTLTPAAQGAVIRGVRLTGGGVGLVANETQDVALTEVEILDPGGYGIAMQRGARLALTRVKIVGAHSYGVSLFGGRLDVAQSVIRGIQPAPSGSLGFGVSAVCDYEGTGGCPEVVLSQSLVADNREVGVGVIGGAVSLSDSVLRDTLPNANSGQAGVGLAAQCDTSVPSCPVVTVTGSVVTGNRSAGVLSTGERTTVRDTVIAGTLEQLSNGERGNGLVVQCDPSTEVCGETAVTCSLIDGNHTAGVSLVGVPAVVVSTIVRGTLAQPSNQSGGQGLLLQCDLVSRECTDASIVRTAVVENTFTGIFSYGAHTALQGVYIADSAPETASGDEGTGFLGQCDNAIPSCPTAELDGTLLERLFAEGLVLFGGTYAVTRSAVYDVLPQLSDGSFGFGVYVDGRTSAASPRLDLADCELRGAVFASAFYVSAVGSIARSRLWGGDYPVILDDSNVTLSDDNELEGNLTDDPLEQ